MTTTETSTTNEPSREDASSGRNLKWCSESIERIPVEGNVREGAESSVGRREEELEEASKMAGELISSSLTRIARQPALPKGSLRHDGPQALPKSGQHDQQPGTRLNQNQLEGSESGVGKQLELYDEPLVAGFALLRLVQLLNFDIYYLGLSRKSNEAARLWRQGDLEAAASVQASMVNFGNQQSAANDREWSRRHDRRQSIAPDDSNYISTKPIKTAPPYYRTILDDLSELNPLQKYIDRWLFLSFLCKLLKIILSLSALVISFEKTASTILLCLMSPSRSLNSTQLQLDYADSSALSNNSGMGQFVLILYDLSATYILFCTVTNGHLIWNLLSQRLFLVSRLFQYKTMIWLLIFVFFEYLVNISFINNLYDWESTSNNIQSGSYSVLTNLRIFVTVQDKENYHVDILLTLIQFARGTIRISPYITINYCIICLIEHIFTIRNQHLLTDSIRKGRKLKLVVKNKKSGESEPGKTLSQRTKKRVIFATDESLKAPSGQPTEVTVTKHTPNGTSNNHNAEWEPVKPLSSPERRTDREGQRAAGRGEVGVAERMYLDKIKDFDELEAYITNLYIFTGRLNRFMSRQGMTLFFIVHNLVITVTMIVPEAARGGIIMAWLISALTIFIAIMPFLLGQSLNRELWLLSKQIDRIIIQQQFTHTRRDNLVRIRELIQDVRINCAGMISFNVRTGIEYLILSFATGFFIEQEHYKLTRRH